MGRLGSRVPALGIKTLSDLEIDVDKDWKAYDIRYLGNLTPKVDGAYSLGGPNAQFDTVYAGLTDNAVTSPKLASDSIYKRHLRTGIVDTSYLTDSGVTTPKIADGDVTSPKLESDIVYKRHLRTGVVDTSYLTDDAVDPTKLASDVIYKHHLRTGVVDTSYLTDNAATSAKVGPSVDLEFVRSNDNVVAGDISAAADGAYNLGSSANKFDTAYANNFPGTAAITAKSGELTTIKGASFRADADVISAVFKGPPNRGNLGVWARQYSSKAAFEPIESHYTLPQAFGSSNAPVLSPNNATLNPEGKTNLFSVSFVPDGTQVGGGFTSLSPSPYGVTWDGEYLWYAGYDANYIYQVTTDGTEVGGFSSQCPGPTGLTWDGTYLWEFDILPDWVYQVTTDGTKVSGFATPTVNFRGLTWDGTYLWGSSTPANYIYKFKADGTQVGGFTSPSVYPSGLGWDGTYLWLSDYNIDYIYQLTPDGTQAGGFNSPNGSPMGLGWDGIYLWHGDSSASFIYQLGSASSMDIVYQVTTLS